MMMCIGASKKKNKRKKKQQHHEISCFYLHYDDSVYIGLWIRRGLSRTVFIGIPFVLFLILDNNKKKLNHDW